MGRARDLANILSSGGNVALDSELGLSLITPTSIAATGGSSSISSTGAVNFTSVSAISLNNVFSSNYTNYRIVVNYTGGQTSGYGTRLRLRVSDTDNSNNSYKTSGFGVADLSSNNIYKNQSNGSISYFDCGSIGSNSYSYMIYDVLNPFESQKTTFTGFWSYLEGDGRWFHNSNGALFDATTSFTGFTIYPVISIITGSIQVYGYRK
jgi:hypothetical protein